MEQNEGSWARWSAIIAGVLAATLAYMVLIALGAGVGGLTATRILSQGGNGSGLTTAAGLWTGGSAIVSLFLGSYFAIRFSDIKHRQVAACQSLLIAALFFVLSLSGWGATMLGSWAGVAGALAAPEFNDLDAVASARAVGSAGWLLFVVLLSGAVAAVVGGVEGTIGNIRRPFARKPVSVERRAA